MNKILMIGMALCFIIAGCTVKEKTISLEQIKDLFEKHEIPLEDPKELHPKSVFLYTLNGVKPEPFMLDGELISIYIYSSSNGVLKGMQDFERQTAGADVAAHGEYQVANVLIFHGYEGTDERVEAVIKDMESLVK
ncbi:hypothetical protein [Paenibacillus mendelii]|uniref:DUF4825 domain-containing protein n=1 Tax=Paenibacillus mendelii TaxID=206163 RepID=A0ABV6J762_9BACL|nr:hypothetical protein [Paenibacillus mendelii]MCQ6561810.1 hypothetical protein [Paenibacillus mendelii]